MSWLAPFIELPRKTPDGALILNPHTGKPEMGLVINPVKEHVRGFWLTSDPVEVTVPAGGVEEIKFVVDIQGPFDWTHIMGTITEPALTLQLFDPGRNRFLQNRPILANLLLGNGQRPFRLPEPYFFDTSMAEERQLIVKIGNLDAMLPKNARIVLYGRRFYDKEAQPDIALRMQDQIKENQRVNTYFLMPKEFPADPNTAPAAVPAGGTVEYTFEADDEADTDVHKFMVFSNGAFEFTLREKKTNRTLSNDVVFFNAGWGTAEFPFYFCDSYLLERQKSLVMRVTDLSGVDNFVIPCIAGRRLYYA